MTDLSVWMYYPNLIGYARIVFALLSFEAMLSAPFRAAIFYILSSSLDAVDGHLARMHNQTSRFGAMLDQLTDRCGLLGLIMALAALYPNYLYFFQLSVVIDIASHWLHFHAIDLTHQVTHKSSSNPVLHLYYTSRKFLFWMCAGNEAFYWLLYINYFWPGPSVFGVHLTILLAMCFFPVAFVKSLISLVHLVSASQMVVEHDRMIARCKK